MSRTSRAVSLGLISALAWTQVPAAPPAPERKPGLYATLETSLGNITSQLWEKEAPAAVENFVNLATGRKSYADPRNNLPSRRPFYNGLTFHRVVPEFMIQTGDPLANGTGATKTIPDEIRPELKFDVPGRVGVANSGPNTGSCQFFITAASAQHLDGLHTIFGQVVEGMEVVMEIAQTPRDSSERPLTPVVIKRVRIERIK